jgi:hypothetical protein
MKQLKKPLILIAMVLAPYLMNGRVTSQNMLCDYSKHEGIHAEASCPETSFAEYLYIIGSVGTLAVVTAFMVVRPMD